jgi:hypothetical protein
MVGAEKKRFDKFVKGLKAWELNAKSMRVEWEKKSDEFLSRMYDSQAITLGSVLDELVFYNFITKKERENSK